MSPTTLSLPAQVRDQLVSCARDGAPDEVCGVLLGTGRESEPIHVTDSRPVANVADEPRTRYELDPGETAQVFASVERERESTDDTARESQDTTEVVGFYHSHPRGPPGPSATDRAQAQWSGYVYLIVSLDGDPRATTDSTRAGTESVAADAGVGGEGADDTSAAIGAWRWTGEAFEPLALQTTDDSRSG